jgi:hypothetical protein
MVETAVLLFCGSNIRYAVPSTCSCVSWCWLVLPVGLCIQIQVSRHTMQQEEAPSNTPCMCLSISSCWVSHPVVSRHTDTQHNRKRQPAPWNAWACRWDYILNIRITKQKHKSLHYLLYMPDNDQCHSKRVPCICTEAFK